jgi:hypothetical protein
LPILERQISRCVLFFGILARKTLPIRNGDISKMKSTFAKWNLWAWDLKSNLGLIVTASDTCRCCLPGRGSTHTHI